MAYSEQTVTSVLDIPAIAVAFAGARGWTTSGTTITRPGGGRSFNISAAITGTNSREHRVLVTDTLDSTRACWSQMPWVNGTAGNPFVLTPTKVHLFGNDTPWSEEPWLAIVIECGFNHYRHIYIGNVVKIGEYTGGEIISANTFRFDASSVPGNSVSFTNTSNRYLCSAKNALSGGGPNSVGGVNIVHANNANTWRRFLGPTGSTPQTAFSGTEVFGGASDNISGGLVRRGVSDFAGSNILVPINLYCPDSSNFGADVRFRPIGHCPGVRMIDMRGLEPGQVIDVGNANWKVFPEFSKRTVQSVLYSTSRPDGGAGGFYSSFETSFMLGLAYPQG